jgi:hypothetical protein
MHAFRSKKHLAILLISRYMHIAKYIQALHTKFNLHLALHVKFYMCNLPDNIILTILPLSYANLKSLTQKLCGLVNRDANQRPSTTRQGSSRLRPLCNNQMYLKRHDISIQKKTYVACTRGETERFDKDAVDEPC